MDILLDTKIAHRINGLTEDSKEKLRGRPRKQWKVIIKQ